MTLIGAAADAGALSKREPDPQRPGADEVVAVGSIGYDTIDAPEWDVFDTLGGSLVHFGLAAGFFTQVRAIGVVGEDFAADDFATLRRRHINTDDVVQVPGGTFRWHGRYGAEFGDAHTVGRYAGVSDAFAPALRPAARGAAIMFLANADPALQLEVLRQCSSRLVGLDSREHWIRCRREQLLDAISAAHVVFLTSGELRLLAREVQELRAVDWLLGLGPAAVVVKHGSRGADIHFADCTASVPAYPVGELVDPTGAGDAFAGGFLGVVACDQVVDLGEADAVMRAMSNGSATASCVIEGFGTMGITAATQDEVDFRARWVLDRATCERRRTTP